MFEIMQRLRGNKCELRCSGNLRKPHYLRSHMISVMCFAVCRIAINEQLKVLGDFAKQTSALTPV